MGMQYARECWCDNNYGSLGQDVDETGCNMPCSGNSDQTCGGSWRNSVYEARGRGLTLRDGLIAEYTFDDQEHPTWDTSGNGHHGVIRSGGNSEQMGGGVTFVEGGGYQRATGSGYLGMAASFDGHSSIVITSLANFVWGHAFSLSVWFNRGCSDQACTGGPTCDGNCERLPLASYTPRPI